MTVPSTRAVRTNGVDLAVETAQANGAIGARIEFGTCNLKHIILYVVGFRRKKEN